MHDELAKTREALKYVTSAIASHLSCRCSGLCTGLISVVDQSGGGWKQGTMENGERYWRHRTFTGDDGKPLYTFENTTGDPNVDPRNMSASNARNMSTPAQVFTRSPLTRTVREAREPTAQQ